MTVGIIFATIIIAFAFILGKHSWSTFLIVFADLILLIGMMFTNATVTSIIFMLLCTILTLSVAIYRYLNEK